MYWDLMEIKHMAYKQPRSGGKTGTQIVRESIVRKPTEKHTWMEGLWRSLEKQSDLGGHLGCDFISYLGGGRNSGNGKFIISLTR